MGVPDNEKRSSWLFRASVARKALFNWLQIDRKVLSATQQPKVSKDFKKRENVWCSDHTNGYVKDGLDVNKKTQNFRSNSILFFEFSMTSKYIAI